MISLHSVEQMVNYMEILLHLYYVEGKGVFYLSYFLYLEQFDCSQHRWDVYGKDFVSNLLWYVFHVFLNLIFRTAMLHELPKIHNFLVKKELQCRKNVILWPAVMLFLLIGIWSTILQLSVSYSEGWTCIFVIFEVQFFWTLIILMALYIH